jgi:hypothetical protein
VSMVGRVEKRAERPHTGRAKTAGMRLWVARIVCLLHGEEEEVYRSLGLISVLLHFWSHLCSAALLVSSLFCCTFGLISVLLHFWSHLSSAALLVSSLFCCTFHTTSLFHSQPLPSASPRGPFTCTASHARVSHIRPFPRSRCCRRAAMRGAVQLDDAKPPHDASAAASTLYHGGE